MRFMCLVDPGDILAHTGGGLAAHADYGKVPRFDNAPLYLEETGKIGFVDSEDFHLRENDPTQGDILDLVEVAVRFFPFFNLEAILKEALRINPNINNVR